ncbi:uncharacterized protein LOC112527496 [Cynara cardunculus var. scolymus]|uniref:uncharacterized protein LOC112527496 n=1 Tax=Cynara cardunculus var. scolymus TaxID=59895 RepID=UPI000D629C84|nr:uncharacterized protein LOC112527496 [Cynara cardunculus var. scolymus]
MGLDNGFGVIKTQILATQPTLGLRTAYHLVVEDERQKLITEDKKPTVEAAAFKAFVPPKRDNFFSSQQKSKTYSKIAKQEEEVQHCTHCDRDGHNREGCFKRIGYPEWWLGKAKGDKTKPRASCVESGSIPIPGLTTEQYNLFLKHFECGTNTGDEGNKRVANMTGRIDNKDDWIVDSGATDHTTYLSNILVNKRKDPLGMPVVIPKGDTIPVEGKGDYTLPGGTRSRGLCSRNLIGAGKCKGGIYRMGMFEEERKAMTVTVERWHKRLGHTSQEKLAKVDFLKGVSFNLRNSFNKSIKRIRCDNGGEFTSNLMLNFYTKQGILLETTYPHTPQQNGVVERKHRHLLDTTRALHFEANLPKRFWGECVLTAAYIINRLPSKTLGDKTPYELLYNQKPKYDHMRVFGCLTYFWSIETKGDKFEVRGRPGIFLGYPQGTKGYKIFDIESKKMVVSRDVKFHESTFTFPAQTQASNDPNVFVPIQAQDVEGQNHEQNHKVEDDGPNSSPPNLDGHMMENDGSRPDTIHEEIPPQNLETHTDLGNSRPKRDRTQPKRLNDFIVDLPPSVDHAHTAST